MIGRLIDRILMGLLIASLVAIGLVLVYETLNTIWLFVS
jgi:hypothetical protein